MDHIWRDQLLRSFLRLQNWPRRPWWLGLSYVWPVFVLVNFVDVLAERKKIMSNHLKLLVLWLRPIFQSSRKFEKKLWLNQLLFHTKSMKEAILPGGNFFFQPACCIARPWFLSNVGESEKLIPLNCQSKIANWGRYICEMQQFNFALPKISLE